MIPDRCLRRIKKVAVVGSVRGLGCGAGADGFCRSYSDNSMLAGVSASVYASEMLGGRPRIRLYSLSAW
jgi:hypothetical protein